jgi:hypothetical protein
VLEKQDGEHSDQGRSDGGALRVIHGHFGAAGAMGAKPLDESGEERRIEVGEYPLAGGERPGRGRVQELPRSCTGHQDAVAGGKGKAPHHVGEELGIRRSLAIVGHVSIDIVRLDD